MWCVLFTSTFARTVLSLCSLCIFCPFPLSPSSVFVLSHTHHKQLFYFSLSSLFSLVSVVSRLRLSARKQARRKNNEHESDMSIRTSVCFASRGQIPRETKKAIGKRTLFLRMRMCAGVKSWTLNPATQKLHISRLARLSSLRHSLSKFSTNKGQCFNGHPHPHPHPLSRTHIDTRKYFTFILQILEQSRLLKTCLTNSQSSSFIYSREKEAH